jgi:ribosomal protein S6--L-glutamate ligase
VKRVCVLLEHGPPLRLNPIIAETIERLEASDVRVTVLVPEETLLRLDRLHIQADLYLLKSDTELALTLATTFEHIGATVLNRASAARRAKDKLLAAATLAQAGLPAPRSLGAARPTQLAEHVGRGRPLILKPHRGYHGVGIAIARHSDDLPDAHVYPDAVFAQAYLDRARTDLKVFVIGDAVFGVRNAVPAAAVVRADNSVSVSPEVEQIARRVGAVFDLELFGLDIAEDPEHGPQIIDVNYSPGFRGVPGAPRHLAEHIARALSFA